MQRRFEAALQIRPIVRTTRFTNSNVNAHPQYASSKQFSRGQVLGCIEVDFNKQLFNLRYLSTSTVVTQFCNLIFEFNKNQEKRFWQASSRRKTQPRRRNQQTAAMQRGLAINSEEIETCSSKYLVVFIENSALAFLSNDSFFSPILISNCGNFTKIWECLH